MLKKSIVCISLLLIFNIIDAQRPKCVSAKQFYFLTEKHPNALILDVRPSEKFAQYRIKNAIPLPTKKELIALARELPRQDTILIYCEIESRSRPAVHALDSLGFTHVYELRGGLISWRRICLPLDDTSLNK